MPDDRPSLSVILPLVDHRRHAEQAVASWLRQSAAADCFEIVVVSPGGSAALEQRLRGRLRPGDQLIRRNSRNEAALYNAGAGAARGSIYLFTESHVLAETGVVAAVLECFARSGIDAGIPASRSIAASPLAKLDGILDDESFSERPAKQRWRDLSLRGLPIRRSAFYQFGPLTEAYGRFAETSLAIRLIEAGRPIDCIPAAVLHHVNVNTPRQVSEPLRLGARGECAFWEREPELAARYLGAVSPRQCCDALKGVRIPLFCQQVIFRARAEGIGFYLQTTLRQARRLSPPETKRLLPQYLRLRQDWMRLGWIDELLGHCSTLAESGGILQRSAA